MGGGHGGEQGDVDALAEPETPFEHGNCRVDVPLAAGEQPNPNKRKRNTVGPLDRLGQPHRLFTQLAPLGETSQFG